MPPKISKTNLDDSKSETASIKERNGLPTKENHQTNGKLRRVASSTGTQLRDATAANGQSSTVTPQVSAPGLNWSSFDRNLLHDYRREHSLDTPTAFANTYHQWVLSRPGGIGLHSPTMARKREYKRQSKEDLAKVVRKHFNGLGIQENEVVVGFLHKVKNPGVPKSRRSKSAPHASPMP
ncbi:hypothetical protein BJ170DRAFT_612225 [Xylariales sp. AK1849]|nr:hypothetical protein BJ170DRAFT_612225 [Xylariales sp. AK1849]